MQVASTKLSEETKRKVITEVAQILQTNEDRVTLQFLEITLDDGSFNLEEMEKNTLIKALTATAGNISKAAGLLGVTRRTVYTLIKKYTIGQFLNTSEK